MKYSEEKLGKFRELKNKMGRKMYLYIFGLILYFLIAGFVLKENVVSLVILSFVLLLIIFQQETTIWNLYDILENEITKFEEKNEKSIGMLQDDILISDAKLHETIHKELKKVNINLSLNDE